MTSRDVTNTIKPVCVARGSIYRLERDGHIVALALRLANGEWGLYDENEKRLSKVAFKTPKMAAEAAERRRLGE